jgi:hypothetical protein
LKGYKNVQEQIYDDTRQGCAVRRLAPLIIGNFYVDLAPGSVKGPPFLM